MHPQPSAAGLAVPLPGPQHVTVTTITAAAAIATDVTTINVTWDQGRTQNFAPARPPALVRSPQRMMAYS